MTALEALSDLVASIGRIHARCPAEQSVARAARDIEAWTTAPPRTPPGNFLEELVPHLLHASATGNWGAIEKKSWRLVPWLLSRRLQGDAQEGEIGGLPGLLPALIVQAVHRPKTFLRRLVHVYLRDYAGGRSWIRELSAAIRVLLPRSDAGAIQKWFQLQIDRELFTFKTGPERLALLLLQGDGGLRAGLNSVGLVNELETGGLAHSAVEDLCTQMRRSLERTTVSAAWMERLLKEFADGPTKTFQELHPRIADAVLLPWVEERQPSEQLKDTLQRRLIEMLDDPRLRPGNWQAVDRRAQMLMRRWLTGMTLKQFFKVIGESALDHQWRFREAFWLSYFERGLLDEAWVAFAPRAREAARHIVEDVPFARLVGPTLDPMHSVLLIRVQGLLFAEWSHHGKCRAWELGHEPCPALYDREYLRAELMAPSLDIDGSRGYSATNGLVHAGAQNGTWQAKLSSFIQRKTNIKMSSRHYMP